MIELGHMLLGAEALGLSRPPNDTEAMAWFQRAAEAGDVEGMFYTAWCHQFGRGTPRNTTAARELYIKWVVLLVDGGWGGVG